MLCQKALEQVLIGLCMIYQTEAEDPVGRPHSEMQVVAACNIEYKCPVSKKLTVIDHQLHVI